MRKLKRAAALFISVLLMMGAVNVPKAMASDMVDFESYDDGSAFSQKFVEVNKISVGKTGQKMSITFDIYNPNTSTDMTNVKIRLATEKEFREIFDIDDSDSGDDDTYRQEFQYPFEFTSDITKVKSDIGTIKVGKKKSVTMSYKVKRNLKEGYYPAVFYLSYGDHNRNIPFGVNIWVTQSDATTESTVNQLDYDFVMGENQSTPYANYNDVMNFSVNLRNSGLKKVYDVRVSMQLDADSTKFPFEINDGNYDRTVGDMEPDQTASIPYSMAVREDVKSGFYPINFKISYREDSSGDFAAPVDKTFFVHVKGKDDKESSANTDDNVGPRARLIVDSFSTDPAEVYAGVPFVLKVKMKNASSNMQATNIMFTFVSEENTDKSPIFTADTGSTSIVVNELSPGATSDLQMVFHPAPTAEQKSYTITIEEKYDGPEVKNASEKVTIAIPVKQKPRLNTGTIEVMPASIPVGSETNVMFGINNTGKVQLYNVMVHFSGDSIQKSDTYVGNIKPGETGNVDTMLTGAAPTAGDGQVKIIISFEDENGNVTEVDKDMMLTVTEDSSTDPSLSEAGNMGGMNGPDGMEDTDHQGFFSRYKIPLAIAGVVAVGAVITVLAVRRKKKKAQLEEEGMDDEIS